MFFINLLIFSNIINDKNIPTSYKKNNSFINPFIYFEVSNKFVTDKIGIVDFRYILKRSNPMKVLGNKFISIEKKINNKFKQKQENLKLKEKKLKKDKSILTEIQYKNKLRLFKEEVFKIQKKYKEERSILNKSFQKIQKKIKDLLAQVIKEVSVRKNINVVLLKENIFLFNNPSIDLTSEVLNDFNEKTKSMKIIITPSK